MNHQYQTQKHPLQKNLQNGLYTIEHIFGPNLHTEVTKQYPVILNFLAVEGRLEYSAHLLYVGCSTVKTLQSVKHDLFPSLTKNLDPIPNSS